ncbi:uncharacterized protein SAPINGB_P002928 [Magnusiomyces paraingens]|uniref:Uncharacterized protein n=1 Tax=Magnusiomyces paraingens TaxID=2606893 RepID=A0A5E8BJ84_9ASCO|nr:uncharacterized protein SAPINGB_P002928 [Saprochaete ingens]VVT50932.1 unnamed protein product [Saprochaete ingens]
MATSDIDIENMALLEASTSSSSSQTTSVSRTDQPSTSSPNPPPSPKPFKKSLISWDDLPHWMRDNHYIHTGYVPQTNSLAHSIHSLTYLHNESVNIYSHLLPAILAIFFCIALAALLTFFSISILPQYPDHPSTPPYLLPDSAAFFIFALGVAGCLGLSATFHTLKSHSHAVATLGNKLDYLGIVLLIVASMVSLVNYSFADMPAPRIFFWSLTLLLGAACATVSLDSKFRTPDWRPYRAAMFVAFGLSGVFPVITGLFVFGLQETAKRSQLFYLLNEAFFYISGAAIYAARIPERWHPGKYDLFGHSHQIFHFFVVIAAVFHGTALYKACQYAHQVTISV